MTTEARFSIGQVVHHSQLGYRGVVVDADAVFEGSEEWHRQVASRHMYTDRPWYHVLVENADYLTYVPEADLAADDSGDPIVHPALDMFFNGYKNCAYRPRYRIN
jgi:heat shock protein HspQ